jgi:protein ImuA
MTPPAQHQATGPEKDRRAKPCAEPGQDRTALIEALRGVLAREGLAPRAGVVPLAAGIDAALPGGGLARGAIHEIIAEETGASTAFCGYVLGRCGGTAAWILPDHGPQAGDDLPWPPGLARLGLAPEALVLLTARGRDALWAAEQALRCPALSAVAAVLPGLGLAAARRLQLAAEAGGTLGLLLRPGAETPGPTASRTRWHVASLPGEGGAPHRLGAPGWRLSLLLARGGAPHCWDVTWDFSTKTLIENDSSEHRAHG